MKIAIVYDVIYPDVVGGAQKRNWEIARRLVPKGNEVTLFGMRHWEGDDIIFRDGVRLWGVCPPQELYVNGRRSMKEAVYFAYKVFGPLLKEKFDVINCQEFPYFPCFTSELTSVLRRTPLIITWLEVWNRYWYQYLGRLGVFGVVVERAVSKLPSTTIAISGSVKRDLVSIGMNGEKVVVVPDGVDVGWIEGVKPQDTEGYDVLYAGRLLQHKNVDVLIKSIELVKKEVPHVRCGIIGDGPERHNLEQLRTELDLTENVDLLGFLEREEDVVAHMKSSKVFVLPSTREGAGLVTLEANAAGLPVITIDHRDNGARDVVVDGQNGFLCELSAQALATKILMAWDRSEQMRDQCVEFARGYDWDRIADLTESVCRDVCRV